MDQPAIAVEPASSCVNAPGSKFAVSKLPFVKACASATAGKATVVARANRKAFMTSSPLHMTSAKTGEFMP